MAACASMHGVIHVESIADPDLDPQSYRSYAWLGYTGVVHDENGRWAPVDIGIGQWLRTSIDAEMQEQGFHLDENAPDILIQCMIVIDEDASDTEITSRRVTLGPNINIPSGSLLLEWIDPKDDRSLWLAFAEAKDLNSRDQTKLESRLKYAIHRLFKQLPR